MGLLSCAERPRLTISGGPENITNDQRPGESALWQLLEIRRIEPLRGRIVAVANQKGGVGKTTTSVNLATGLALRGHRVLIVDVDPQSNATTGLGVDHRGTTRSTYDLIVDQAPVAEVIMPTAIKGLDLAPGSPDLAGAEVELVTTSERERRLSSALAGTSSRYDVVFLDCPPSLGLLTVNALVAAQDLLVPVQCEYYALEGLGQLLDTTERVHSGLNPHLRIGGVLLTMYDGRTKLSSQVADEIKSHFGEFVFETVVPRSVRLSEAPSFGEPVLTLDPSARGAISYRLLAAEFEARFGLETRVPEPPPRPTPGAPSPPARALQGPGGRGFGVKVAEPAGLESAWPPPDPWGTS